MPNANYVKGRRKEYEVINKAKEQGLIAFRSAGSHSPIDVVLIDKGKRIIKFIQCKPDSMSQNKRNEILEQQRDLADTYFVTFEVI